VKKAGHPLLRVETLKVEPLPPLTFTVANGECLAVEGPSGSGKTRLLRAIADLDDAPGHIFVDGAERHEVRGPKWRRRVRYASAGTAWWTTSARDAFNLQPAGRSPPRPHARRARLDALILDKPLSDLSTGERQRPGAAPIDEPRVLLLDEASTGLDPQTAALVEEADPLSVARRPVGCHSRATIKVRSVSLPTRAAIGEALTMRGGSRP
jgi:ABC-type iron transport system FetAB ATPase subunit